MLNFIVLCFTMMFNGLVVCGDSDTSDFTKESIGSSRAGSAASEERSRCLERKLSAALEVLKNKEETVRVQAESLALAEARIAALSARSARRHDQPLHSTRSSADGCCVDNDVNTQTPEADDRMVSTLQGNLSIIEELYRESFYEAAKQEQLIDLLRKSCLDVRSVERQKEARIGHLQSVVTTQQWSLDRCQDIALEVENLKSEISNFLNNSNHDSGMWERPEESLGAEVADELHHISGQLLQLKELLKDGCSCGLEEENMRLKRVNEKLEIQLGELRHRVCELEAALEDKENMGHRYCTQIQLKDQELSCLQQQLSALQQGAEEHRTHCSELNTKVQQLQELLHERSEELACAQRHCEQQAATVVRLRGQLGQAEETSKESVRVRGEVAELSAAVAQWRAQLSAARARLRALADERRRERDHCRRLHQHCQEKEEVAAELQAQLEEARARGAALCGEAQHAVCAVRRWLRRQRHRHREQEQKIMEQDKLIRALQQRPLSDGNSSEACCSRALARAERATGTASCSQCPSLTRTERASRTASCSRRPSASRAECASGTASCSRRPSLPRDACVSAGVSTCDTSESAPTPPRRLKKKPTCDNRECQWPSSREAGSQQPARADASTRSLHHDSCDCETSPTEELLERVERTHEALQAARRRWRRRT